MGPVDYVILAVIAMILGLAAWYIVRAKKKGRKCIGCPDSASCAAKGCGGCSGCSCGKKQ